MTDAFALTPSHPARRDHLPLWVIALLVLFAVLRVTDLAAPPVPAPGPAAARLAPKNDGGGMDTDSMQDLIQTDVEAKTAFAASFASPPAPGAVVRPDPVTLKLALHSAENLLRESQAPGAARRLILLRALLVQNAVPPLSGSHGYDPLSAFTTSLPPGTSPRDRTRYAAEATLWQTVFEGGALSPKQIAAAAVQINSLPGIRWWRFPALMALYQGQGDLSEAARYARRARLDALPSLVPVTLISVFRLGMMGVGLLLLIYLLVRGKERRPAGTDYWPPVPASLPDSERRLGAGDLMAVFVVYLLAREMIGMALTGFGVPHLFYLRGLLAPFRPVLAQMPAAGRTSVSVGLEGAVYVLSAVPPVLYLWTMARRRGASLASEIGWRARPVGTNALCGAGGFALASVLMLPVVALGRIIFRHAPDPSNPVIPQIISASGVGTILLLVGLASVAAPLVEELLFRGVLYQAVRLKLGAWPAIVVTGLVFGFVHPVGIADMLVIAVLGGVFAWMAETRQSLLPGMVAHCLQNFTTTLLLLFILAG